MVASTKAIQIRPAPFGSANPKVVSEETLISNARDQERSYVPQYTQVNASIMKIIQTSGRLTRATGAYSRRSDRASRSLRHRWTRSR